MILTLVGAFFLVSAFVIQRFRKVSKTWQSEIHSAGMTLVELLLVLGIISILMGLLLPAVQSGREAVRSVQCKNKIRQLALGLSLHEAALNRLPIGHERINGEYNSNDNTMPSCAEYASNMKAK